MKKMMITGVLLICGTVLLNAAQGTNAEFKGLWLSANQKFIVEFYETNSSLIGRTVWVSPDAGKDTLKALGRNTITGLTAQKSTPLCYKGKITAGGNQGDFTMRLRNNRELEVKMRVFGMTRKVIWTRSTNLLTNP